MLKKYLVPSVRCGGEVQSDAGEGKLKHANQEFQLGLRTFKRGRSSSRRTWYDTIGMSRGFCSPAFVTVSCKNLIWAQGHTKRVAIESIDLLM